jgi:hypothetical protein
MVIREARVANGQTDLIICPKMGEFYFAGRNESFAVAWKARRMY